MAKKQYYGITYPFTSLNDERTFVDVNKDIKSKARSLIMHVIFTPKGQKIRDPEFGTKLIQYIFEPNDTLSWEDIKTEISDAVRKYVYGMTLNDISIMNEDDQNKIYVRIDYSISSGFNKITDSIIAEL